MKLRSLVTTCLIFLLANFTFAQQHQYTCYFGFSFKISNNPCWGYGEPVITSVDPNSNAEKAGLKAGDIIMEVNGKATYLRHYDLIASWIFDNTSREVNFTIRNLNNTFKGVTLTRFCRGDNEVEENELANTFSLYSVESNCKRVFIIPLAIEANQNVDFTDYYSYKFSFKGKQAGEFDDYIVHEISKELNRRGLHQDVNDPDIIIQIDYSFAPNEKYSAEFASQSTAAQWRFDLNLKKMEKMPVKSLNDYPEGPGVSVRGLANLEIQFSENKYANPGKMTRIWDAHFQEYIVGDYSFENYCRIMVPLMISSYPCQMPTKEVKYSADMKEYYYTGLSYNREKISTVENVVLNSPAYYAGLRRGDKILSVNKILFPATWDAAKIAYSNFLSSTMEYRNKTDPFYNDKVQDISFPWDNFFYDKISKNFKDKAFSCGFSYLYAFEPYVDSKEMTKLKFQVERDGDKFSVEVAPIMQKSAQLILENQ